MFRGERAFFWQPAHALSKSRFASERDSSTKPLLQGRKRRYAVGAVASNARSARRLVHGHIGGTADSSACLRFASSADLKLPCPASARCSTHTDFALKMRLVMVPPVG